VDLRLLATSRITGETDGEAESLGRRLRALRTEHGITLAQLGSMVGLSASYLSQIERNKAKPSLVTLSSVAETLGVELRSFFEHSTPVWKVVRKGRGEGFGSGGAKISFELLSSGGVRGKFKPYRVTCWPGMDISAEGHRGEEFVFVLDGQIQIGVGEEIHSLMDGDSIHYQGNQPHAWRNKSEQECTLIWALSPPFVPSTGEEGG
jgi:quercetin dioxygenase-like cupin family protein/DNA-binding XRE family transcriptional regulator